MKEVPENAYQVERLSPEEFQTAREQNIAELERHSRTRLYIIEETRTFPDCVEFSYAVFSYEVPIVAKNHIRPGSKILFVQRSENPISAIEGVYALGENLQQSPIVPSE